MDCHPQIVLEFAGVNGAELDVSQDRAIGPTLKRQRSGCSNEVTERGGRRADLNQEVRVVACTPRPGLGAR